MIHRNLFFLPEILSLLIFTQSENGDFYVQATSRQKPRRALPEEIIRQLFVLSLIHQYGYPEDRIRLEFGVQMGRERKRADIIILDQKSRPYIVVEVKQELNQFALEQLDSYVTITRASFGIAVSADQFHCVKNNGTTCDDLPIFCNITDNDESKDINQIIEDIVSVPPLEIDRFERISPSHVKLTIQGHQITLTNIELDSYSKLRKYFLAKGVALETNIRPQEWRSFVARLLNTTPITTFPSWVWILETTLAAISFDQFSHPYKYEVIDVNGYEEKCLLIRPGHIVDYITNAPELGERLAEHPIKSAQALRKQLDESGIIVKQGMERVISTKRVPHLDALSVLKLNDFGLHIT